jgi:hypothetical protein
MTPSGTHCQLPPADQYLQGCASRTALPESAMNILSRISLYRPHGGFRALVPARRIGGGLLLAALAGCANPTSVAPGTPLADVEQGYGKPSYTCTRPDGTRRVVWSQQPSGSYAWGTDVDAQGRVVKVEEVLNDTHFRLMREDWTPEQVRCEFGQPAEIREAGLGEKREVVWSYRYVQDIRWHSVMWVYMGADGKAVTHYHSGPDDRYQRSE